MLLRRLFPILVMASIFVLTGPLSSCKKTKFFSNGNLTFSADTVVFDTVFTTIGSTTHHFKAYNNDKRTVTIEEVELMGGSNSPFRINVDGVSGIYHSNLDVEGNDSLFIFVEVTLDPNGGTLPLVIEDSIRFKTNGVDQYVILAAWGQDAYFHYSDFTAGSLDTNSGTWPNDKPHVIYGGAFIDSAQTLNIQAGTQIYLHKNAILYNYKGTLNINGTYGNEVVFQGDRLESAYDDVAGQYYGIYFHEARESTINYAIIKNGTSGIHLYDNNSVNPNYTLNLYNTVITNCARYGVFIYSGAKVKAENCIISKNGTHGLLVLEGGDFNFNFCHILGYGSGDNVAAAVGLSNYYVDYANAVTNVGSINEGTITNSILYGNLDHELAIDTISDVAITLNFLFKNNVIRSDDIFSGPYFPYNIWNSDPQFMDVSTGDFHWYSTSPMEASADNFYGIPFDIENKARNGSTPDIGAYEKY